MTSPCNDQNPGAQDFMTFLPYESAAWRLPTSTMYFCQQLTVLKGSCQKPETQLSKHICVQAASACKLHLRCSMDLDLRTQHTVADAMTQLLTGCNDTLQVTKLTCMQLVLQLLLGTSSRKGSLHAALVPTGRY